MWCFPEFESIDACEASLAESGVENYQQTLLPKFRHTFSHFHFDISPILIEVESLGCEQVSEQTGALWYNLSYPPKVGLAAATKKILTSVDKIIEKE